MKLKRMLILSCLLCLLVGVLALSAAADEIVDSGTCGDHLTWTLDSEGTLTISGRGEVWSNAFKDALSVKKLCFWTALPILGTAHSPVAPA